MQEAYKVLEPMINEARAKRMLIQHIIDPGIMTPEEFDNLNKQGAHQYPHPKFWRLRDPALIIEHLDSQIGTLLLQKLRIKKYQTEGK